ncbi:MAG: hypothetical protein RL681_824 [Candidatus Parcubacteria bacterium]
MPDNERTELLVQVFGWIQRRRGFLPRAAYWARLLAFPVVYHEVVTFAPSDDGEEWEVLLDGARERPADDQFYAGKLCTQGSTVMMRQSFTQLSARHMQEESRILFGSTDDFQFCGLSVAPWTKRDHAYVVVFSRLLPRKPKAYQGIWVSVDRLADAGVAASNRAHVDMAIAVTLRGAQPYYSEYKGVEE